MSTDLLFHALDRQRIETPSWGYGNSGTRFETFAAPGAARNVHGKIEDAAEAVEPGGPLINPDDSRFLHPGLDMPDRVRAFCAETGQRVPQTPAEITRCPLESVALRTAQVLGELEKVTGTPTHTVHVVGGGSQIRLLNQLIADTSGRNVIAGPVEATLMGNLLVQAEAQGSIPKGGIRNVVRASATLELTFPRRQVTAARRARFSRLTRAEVLRED